MFAAILLAGCATSSGSLSPTQPGVEPVGVVSHSGTHLLGLYDIIIDTDTLQAEIIPNRSAEIELNILKFLEAPGVNGILISNLQIDHPEMSFEMGIWHPFAGSPEFTIFSTRGVFLSDGTMSGFANPAIVMSSPDEMRLLNADGYTRWMNPVEFPYDGTILNYYPGKYGNQNGGDFLSTINPYKLFADGLSALPDNMNLDESMKSVFFAGNLNWRHYEFDFHGQGIFQFQYAVVASWEPPLTNPPHGPDDYPSGTVATEPWRVDVVELQNNLSYIDDVQSGELILQVLVRDFENADQDTVYIESPGIFPRQEMTFTSQEGDHLTFELNVQNIVLVSADSFEVLVSAVALDGVGYDGRLPGQELATYVLYEVSVESDITIPGWPFYDDFENYEYEWVANGGDWWGELNGFMHAAGGVTGGGTCYEEDTGSQDENPNVSYVSSPPIDVPDSIKDLIIVFNHEIQVDPVELFGHFAWDMCFVRVNGEQVFPTGGPPYEDNYYPMTFDPIKCWTDEYDWTESTFNLGTDYNGTTITVEFVLDTYDYVDNCLPYNFGWHIEDILVDFAD